MPSPCLIFISWAQGTTGTGAGPARRHDPDVFGLALLSWLFLIPPVRAQTRACPGCRRSVAIALPASAMCWFLAMLGARLLAPGDGQVRGRFLPARGRHHSECCCPTWVYALVQACTGPFHKQHPSPTSAWAMFLRVLGEPPALRPDHDRAEPTLISRPADRGCQPAAG